MPSSPLSRTTTPRTPPLSRLTLAVLVPPFLTWRSRLRRMLLRQPSKKLKKTEKTKKKLFSVIPLLWYPSSIMSFLLVLWEVGEFVSFQADSFLECVCWMYIFFSYVVLTFFFSGEAFVVVTPCVLIVIVQWKKHPRVHETRFYSYEPVKVHFWYIVQRTSYFICIFSSEGYNLWTNIQKQRHRWCTDRAHPCRIPRYFFNQVKSFFFTNQEINNHNLFSSIKKETKKEFRAVQPDS